MSWERTGENMPDSGMVGEDLPGGSMSRGDMSGGDLPNGGMSRRDTSSGDASNDNSSGGFRNNGEKQEENGTGKNKNRTMYQVTGEEQTMLIPVGTIVTTQFGTTTTFSRLAAGDMIKILLEKNENNEDVIVGIWMIQ